LNRSDIKDIYNIANYFNVKYMFFFLNKYEDFTKSTAVFNRMFIEHQN